MPGKKTTKKKATKPKATGSKVKLIKTKNNRYYMKAANGRAICRQAWINNVISKKEI